MFSVRFPSKVVTDEGDPGLRTEEGKRSDMMVLNDSFPSCPVCWYPEVSGVQPVVCICFVDVC